MKILTLLILFFISACGSSGKDNSDQKNTARANITYVSTTQVSDLDYTFHVKIKSDETGCDQYADWWEVLKADGSLLYRRILAHSHPDDQPFTRSGGPVKTTKNETLYIRAHMNKLGYVGDVYTGSVANGFVKAKTPPAFPDKLAEQDPLPNGCAF